MKSGSYLMLMATLEPASNYGLSGSILKSGILNPLNPLREFGISGFAGCRSGLRCRLYCIVL